MVNIGIIGVGFMGYTHFEAAKQLQNARVAAIATRNEQKRNGNWTGIQGNFGPPAGEVDLSDISAYADYHDLLNDPNVDLVDICLPTDLHEHVVLKALAARKPVLVEKPIAIQPAAADRMVEAAKKANLPLMVGHVLPFFPEFRYAAELIQNQAWGKLKAAHLRRVMTPPEWSSDIADFQKLGGWGIDLHIHDNHFICHACGVPNAVFSRGILQEGFVNHVHSQYLYDDAELAVSCVSGGIAAKGLAFGHGFELYFENATLLYDAGTYGDEWVVNRPLTLIHQSGEIELVEPPGGSEWCSAFTDELQLAVDVLTKGKSPGALDGNMALQALRLCHAEAESIQSRSICQL